MLSIGIVGLPNVGKSTLFNAITNSNVEAANYPFCTIEPNIGTVIVPDARLQALARINGSQKIINSVVKFVDIAGLVKNASKGEGLGNKFLSHIASVSAIAHVVRCFEDEKIAHVTGNVNPIDDIETINLELLLSDLQLLHKAKDSKKRSKEQIEEINKAIYILEHGNLSDLKELKTLKELNLIVSKPMILVANVKEEDILTGNSLTRKVEEYAKLKGLEVVIISAKIEHEISMLKDDKELFLKDLGLESSSLDNLIVKGYSILGLISFFTVGPKEARSWTIKRGQSAYEASAKIHDDIQRGFIRAEITSYGDYIKTNGKPKEEGLLRLEGKDYIMQDGDVVHFRFNV